MDTACQKHFQNEFRECSNILVEALCCSSHSWTRAWTATLAASRKYRVFVLAAQTYLNERRKRCKQKVTLYRKPLSLRPLHSPSSSEAISTCIVLWPLFRILLLVKRSVEIWCILDIITLHLHDERVWCRVGRSFIRGAIWCVETPLLRAPHDTLVTIGLETTRLFAALSFAPATYTRSI